MSAEFFENYGEPSDGSEEITSDERAELNAYAKVLWETVHEAYLGEAVLPMAGFDSHTVTFNPNNNTAFFIRRQNEDGVCFDKVGIMREEDGQYTIGRMMDFFDTAQYPSGHTPVKSGFLCIYQISTGGALTYDRDWGMRVEGDRGELTVAAELGYEEPFLQAELHYDCSDEARVEPPMNRDDYAMLRELLSPLTRIR